MPAVTVTVGSVEVTAILDIDTELPLDEILDGTTDPLPEGSAPLDARYPHDFVGDAWRFRDRCFLVRTATKLTLIDAGVGPVDSAFGRWLGLGGTLADELATLGVETDEIDDVVMTHAHSDHIGWATRASSDTWVPRFANARYHLHAMDLAWMSDLDDEESVREFGDVIAPLRSAGQLVTSVEDAEVSPGLMLRHAPGHTPGHRCVLLDAGTERIVFAGDLIHFTFQLNDPAFHPPGDCDPEVAARTRRSWLDRVESDGLTLATAHLPPFPFGRIVREDGRRVLRRR